MKRFFCSLRDTLRKNFSTAVPLRARYSSKPAMSCRRCFQMFFVTSFVRRLLPREDLLVHAHHQHLLVVRAVEDADSATLRQALHVAPEIVVVEVLRRGHLERVHLAALRVHARHDVADGAVLARRVHRLEHAQQRPAVLRVELVLLLGQPLHAVGEHLLRLRPCARSRCRGYRPGSMSLRRNFRPLVTRYGATKRSMRFSIALRDMRSSSSGHFAAALGAGSRESPSGLGADWSARSTQPPPIAL